MAIGLLNKESFNIIVKQGTSTNLALSTTYLQQGELAYTTDDKQLHIVDGSNNKLNIPTFSSDVNITRLGAASLAIGNGTANNTAGNLSLNTIISYNGVATVNSGVGSQVAASDLTTQNAAIAATTIYAVPAAGAGLYRVSYVATITAVDGVSSVLGGATGFQVKFQNKSDSVVKTSNPTTPAISAIDATTTTVSGDLYANCLASSNLQYIMGYTSATPGNMKYDLSIRVEYLG